MFELSEQAEISVITCGPDQKELYSAFGHSAFRVYDPAHGIDEAYNYGVFDFDQPNFYLNFARGYSYYKLGVMEYPRFKYIYEYYNRFIHEQKLNLTTTEKDSLYAFLRWNAQPENQSYLYDYFYDNCATKIRDVVVLVFGDNVQFDDTHVTTDYTIRDLTDLYLQYQPWGDLAIDICLGLPMDKKATPYEYMFLPDYIERGFDNATILRDGNQLPLVKEKIEVYKNRPEEITYTYPHPWIIFGFLFLIVSFVSFRDWNKKILSNWLDVILLTTTGLLGLLLLLLWVGTNHQAAAKNFNLIWALPTHLIVGILLLIKKKKKWMKQYFLIAHLITLLLLFSWIFLPQPIHPFLLPVVAALSVRFIVNYRIRRISPFN